MTKNTTKAAGDDKTAAIYVRVSTAGQDDKGTSPARQEAECRALAKAAGFRVTKVYSDVMSGRRDDRPEFQQMIADGEAGGFKRVYVWSVDRFARSLAGAFTAVERLEKKGIIVISKTEGDMSDETRFAFLSIMAKGELRRIRERTLPAKLLKRDAGLFVTGKEPYGYRKQPDKTLTKCPVESRIVRQIFADCIAGHGRVQIANRLNDARFVPLEMKVLFPGEDKPRRVRPGHILADDGEMGFADWLEENGMAGPRPGPGQASVIRSGAVGIPKWHTRSVSRVLDNKAAAGFLTSNGDRREIRLQIADGPIISVEEWDAAQRAKAERRNVGRRPARPWFLTSKIVCGLCGSRYIHHQGRGKSEHYYRCNARRMAKRCTSPHVRMDAADDKVLDLIASRLNRHFGDHDKLVGLVAKANRQSLDTLEAKRDRLDPRQKRARRRWDDAQADFAAVRAAGLTPADMPTMAAKVREARQEFDKLSAEMTHTLDQIANLKAHQQATKDEIVETAGRIQRAIQVAAGQGADFEPATDLLHVVKVMVESVTVRSDKSLAVKLASDDDVLRRLFEKLRADALDETRLFRSFTGKTKRGRRPAGLQKRAWF